MGTGTYAKETRCSEFSRAFRIIAANGAVVMLIDDDSAYFRGAESCAAIIAFDEQGVIAWHNQDASELIGSERLTGTQLERWLAPNQSEDDGSCRICPCLERSANCPPTQHKQRWQIANGRGSVEVDLAPIEVPTRICVATMRRAGRSAESSSELRILAQAMAQSDDMVLITNATGSIIYVNPSFERVTGYSGDEVIGKSPAMLQSGKHSREFYQDLKRTLQAGKPFHSVFINRRRNGDLYHEQKTITPLFGPDGKVSHYVSTAKDITERIQDQRWMEHLASYDLLTDLPNRRLFADQFSQAMQRASRDGSRLALLFLDLDRFKTINDSLGHNAGDLLLRSVADRLRACARKEDTVARLGGDEFAIVLERLNQFEDAARVAQMVINAFDEAFKLEGREVYLSTSIGIACYPDHGDNPEHLLKHADIAMYQAKAAGSNLHVLFDSSMQSEMLENLSMETSLRGALGRDEFHLLYQPIFERRTGRLAKLEVLMRWTSPEHGSVPPSRFIPILEATGLILPVGRWLIESALRQVGEFQQQRYPDVQLAVNISGRQFRQASFVDEVRQLLEATGFPPKLLEFEITESILIENAPAATCILDALHGLGISLAIDDFGTGYSSLSYLRRFPISTLKIDRSFVTDIEESVDAVSIVRAVINLADALGLEVVGEGVESVGQLDLLHELGCHYIQGFLFSKPGLLADLASFLIPNPTH